MADLTILMTMAINEQIKHSDTVTISNILLYLFYSRNNLISNFHLKI